MKLERLVVGMVETNCYIAMNEKSKKAFLVDPGDEATRICDRIESMGASLDVILLTHGHFDHAGAAEEIAEKYGVEIVALDKERETLETPNLNLSYGMGGRSQTFHATNYVSHNETVMAAGYSLRVIATPGHTVGGCCFYLGTEGILFTGDTLFCGSVGRTDFPGGSMSALVRGIKEYLLPLPEQTICLPGHGPRTTIEQERIYNPYVS